MSKKRGIGVGSMYYGIGYGFNRPDIGAALIEMAEDSTTTVYSGACDMGQGVMTIVAQVAAEGLGINPGAVRVVAADTGSTPDSGPTSASRSTFVQGLTVQKAAADLQQELLQMAAEMLDRPAEELEAFDGQIYGSGNPEPLLPVAEVSSEMHRLGKRCTALGWHDNTTKDVNPETSQGDAYATYGWATQLAEVEVDTETGHVRVIKIVSATDVGKAINPVGVEGQIQGGAAMGLGHALYEQHILNQGVPQTGSLAFYLVPTSMDVPEIECEIVEVADPNGPYGAKGMAEPATIPTTPAILNAIYDAVGVRISETPATPERVYLAIQEAIARGEPMD
ncbi:MAG: molybdopterin-dependent oxidoreductase [Arenicellales bacterium]|jgi:CO/xanthine dehydrogenase Mo-binding subunit|nr:molybdopterin-dependent oxidoreductase [Arenicellales bacterium]